MAFRPALENPLVARLREEARRHVVAPPPPPPPDKALEERRSATMAGLCNLPAFHPVAIKLLGISTESDTAMAEYADAFSADPALAAELLRRANSAEFGQLAYIGDIQRALMTLGLDRTRSLVVSISMNFYARKAARKADVYPLWAHSMATAVLAELISNACRTGIANSHTSGLIHDLGRLGFLLNDPDVYLKILSSKPPGRDELTRMEKSAFGMDHCEGGVVMAGRWGFPESLRDCIHYHHAHHIGGVETPLGLVQTACRLADALGFPEIDLAQPEDPMEVLPQSLHAHPDFAPGVLKDLLTTRLTDLWS